MPIGGDFMDKRSDKTYHRQYIKNKKKFLQMEIKNTADPDTKLALTKLLIEIERREKKYRIIGMTLIIVLCLISFLLYLGNQSMKNDLNANNNQQQNSPTPSSSLESTSTESSVIGSSAIETHLSAEQIEQWVMSVLELAPPVPTRYLLSTYLDDKDNLVYVRAGVDQFDNVGLFRVNAKGHLEYLSRIPGADWVLMSDKYMDTSIAEEYYKNLKNTYHNDKDTISEEELSTYSEDEVDAASYMELYSPVLNKYKRYYHHGQEKMVPDTNPVAMMAFDKHPDTTLSYSLMNLTGDGIDNLIISLGDNILDLYGIVDGEVIRLTDTDDLGMIGERTRLYILDNGQLGYIGSGGSQYISYILYDFNSDGTALIKTKEFNTSPENMEVPSEFDIIGSRLNRNDLNLKELSKVD